MLKLKQHPVPQNVKVKLGNYFSFIYHHSKTSGVTLTLMSVKCRCFPVSPERMYLSVCNRSVWF